MGAFAAGVSMLDLQVGHANGQSRRTLIRIGARRSKTNVTVGQVQQTASYIPYFLHARSRFDEQPFRCLQGDVQPFPRRTLQRCVARDRLETEDQSLEVLKKGILKFEDHPFATAARGFTGFGTPPGYFENPSDPCQPPARVSDDAGQFADVRGVSNIIGHTR